MTHSNKIANNTKNNTIMLRSIFGMIMGLHVLFAFFFTMAMLSSPPHNVADFLIFLAINALTLAMNIGIYLYASQLKTTCKIRTPEQKSVKVKRATRQKLSELGISKYITDIVWGPDILLDGTVYQAITYPVNDGLIETIKSAEAVYVIYNEHRIPFEDNKLSLVILNNRDGVLIQDQFKRVLERVQLGESVVETYKIVRA